MKSLSVAPYALIKGILLVCLLLFWIPFFLPTGIYSQAAFDKVQNALSADLDSNYYTLQDEQALRRYLGLEASNFDGIAFYRVGDALSARELVLAKSEDAAVLSQFADAIQKRIASQISIYEGYAPEQTALMEDALVDVQDNYALYYVGSSPKEKDQQFLASLKGE